MYMEKDEKKKGAMLDEAFLQNLMQNEQVEWLMADGVEVADGKVDLTRYGIK